MPSQEHSWLPAESLDGDGVGSSSIKSRFGIEVTSGGEVGMSKSVQGVDGGIGFELDGYFNSMNLVQIYVTDIILYITTKLFK